MYIDLIHSFKLLFFAIDFNFDRVLNSRSAIFTLGTREAKAVQDRRAKLFKTLSGIHSDCHRKPLCGLVQPAGMRCHAPRTKSISLNETFGKGGGGLLRRDVDEIEMISIGISDLLSQLAVGC